MPRYLFAHKTPAGGGEIGYVQMETFEAALAEIGEHLSAEEGDVLELGVAGFPPAQFLCTRAGKWGSVSWQPASRLAA